MTSHSRERLALFLPDLRGGGAERVALALACDFTASGYPTDLVLARANGELLALVPPEVEVHDLGAARLRDSVRPLAAYLRRYRPRAVHAIMWPMPILALAARVLSGVTVRVVGSEHVAASQKYPRATRRWLAGSARRAVYPRLDAVVAVSQGVAEDLETFCGLDPRYITTIYNPVDFPDSGKAAPDARAAWPTQSGRLLAVGTLKAQKNYPLLIDALALVRSRCEASLVIVGDGPDRDGIVAYAASRGLTQAIRFAGYTNDPWPFYRGAEAFVLASDYEGLGNVLIEALHAGLPVVATDCRSGPREILAGGRYGRLTPPGDAAALAAAILSSLQDDSGSAATSGPRRADELSGRVAMEKHLAVMLGSSRRRY